MQYFVDGRRIRESTKRQLAREAQLVLRDRLIEIERQSQDTNAAGTIAQLYTGLDNDYSMNGRKTLNHVRSLWKNHLAPHFATLHAGQLTTSQISEYIRHRQSAGAKNASINRELSALKRMHRLALKSGRLRVAPYIPMLKERNTRTGFLRDCDYDALASATMDFGLWLRAMFEVAYTYGWRRGELVNMRVRQIDLAAGTIELNPGETKNDQGRVMEMTPVVRDLIAQLITGKSPGDLVFTRCNGRPPGNFRRIWARACETAGVPGLLFHDLRRSGVRNMRRAGISEKVAMTISGHKTRAVFERYNIVDPSDLTDAAKRLQNRVPSRRNDDPDPGRVTTPPDQTPPRIDGKRKSRGVFGRRGKA